MWSENTPERKRTDVPAIYVCIAFIIFIFGGFVAYAFFNASIYRLSNGIDDCGNICGMKNDGNILTYCGSNNKEVLPFTLVNITRNAVDPNITDTHSKCVRSCSDFPGYIEAANRCFFVNSTESTKFEFSSFIHAISEDLVNSWSSILVSCIVALVFSYILLVLFRYAIRYVIWGIYIGGLVLLVTGSVVLLIFFIIAKVNSTGTEEEFTRSIVLLFFSAFLLIAALFMALFLYIMWKRIRLVIQLFKEASKALGDIPLIVTEPLLTFLAMGVTFVGFLYCGLIIESSGHLEIENDESGKFLKATYEKDIGMKIAHYVNLVAFIWFTQFIIGCQHFVIAGTVCQWFFARTKTKIESPIRRSFGHLLRFHIGSICLGSIFITLVKIIRMLVQAIKQAVAKSGGTAAAVLACCCEYIVEQIERFLQYLVRNAYIIVALEGTPLIESGKKAFKLLADNLIDVIALNNVGAFVLFLGRVFVSLIAGFVTYEFVSRNDSVNYKFIPIALSVIFAFLIVHCFMTVYDMTLDTIFICFCIDCEQNDGTSRPYFMSRKMMEVMIELKGMAGGDFSNFGAFKHGAAEPMLQNQNVEAGVTGPMIPPKIPPNFQFS